MKGLYKALEDIVWLTQLGLSMLLPLLLCLGGCWWAVNRWGWPEWVFLPGVFLGLAAGVYMAGWKKTGVVLYVFSGVIGFSRIYLGVHFPSDVIGGAVVGVLCAWGARKFIDLAGKTQKVQKKGRKRK